LVWPAFAVAVVAAAPTAKAVASTNLVRIAAPFGVGRLRSATTVATAAEEPLRLY